MHRFFNDGFEPLHLLTLEFLAHDTAHALLPLLGVCRSLRRLAVARMLKVYRSEEVVKLVKDAEGNKTIPVVEEGEFVLIKETCINRDGLNEWHDPRSVLHYFFESPDNSCTLLFSSIDHNTMVCTFKPTKKTSSIAYELQCYEDHDIADEETLFKKPIFDVLPTEWFRKAKRTTSFVLDGYELGARPDCFPPVFGTILQPCLPKLPVGDELATTASSVTVKEDTVTLAYSGRERVRLADRCSAPSAYKNTRLDFAATPDQPDDPEWTYVRIPAVLEMKSLKIPFINLFTARHVYEYFGQSH